MGPAKSHVRIMARVPAISMPSLGLRLIVGSILGMFGACLGWAALEPFFHEGGAPGIGGLANAFQFPMVCGMIGACARLSSLPRMELSGAAASEFVTGFCPPFAAAFLLLIPARLTFRWFAPPPEVEVALRQWCGLTSVVVARSLAWAVVGGAMGVGLWVGSRRSLSLVTSATGGCAAGLVAGLVFDPLQAYLLHHGAAVAWPSRAVGFVILGGITGAFAGASHNPSMHSPGLVGDGPFHSGHHPIGFTPCLIGSDPECDIVLPASLGVKSVHAVVTRNGNALQLRGAGTLPTCTVNGRSTRRVNIEHGDRIRLGHCCLVLSNPNAEKAREGRPSTKALLKHAGCQPECPK